MRRLFAGRTRKAGTAPGTLIHVGKPQTQTPRFHLISYDAQRLDEQTWDSADAMIAAVDSDRLNWINVDGVHDTDAVQAIGNRFRIHPLTLEDIVNTTHRPKAEAIDDYIHLVVKMLRIDPAGGTVHSEQVSLVVFERTLISFQEVPGDVFDGVRERLRSGRSRIRSAPCDYLAYALLDAVVDYYFAALDEIGGRIETLEDTLLSDRYPVAEAMASIHALKQEVIFLRRQVWPLREVINSLVRNEFPLVQADTAVFFRDVYDHAIHVMETIESYRDLLAGLLDLHLSTVSNRMNEVMKVLTIIATIFIPITFIAGVYGMNFKTMPELEWAWGYPAVLAIMVMIAGGLLYFFKRKQWL